MPEVRDNSPPIAHDDNGVWVAVVGRDTLCLFAGENELEECAGAGRFVWFVVAHYYYISK